MLPGLSPSGDGSGTDFDAFGLHVELTAQAEQLNQGGASGSHRNRAVKWPAWSPRPE